MASRKPMQHVLGLYPPIASWQRQEYTDKTEPGIEQTSNKETFAYISAQDNKIGLELEEVRVVKRSIRIQHESKALAW